MPDFRFNLPTLGQMTPAQQIALMSNAPLLITGGPGSGKTVVSVRRLLRLKAAKKRVKLFTFNRTLMAAIRGLAKSENFDSTIVDSFYDWYYTNTAGIFANDTPETIALRLGNFATANNGRYHEVIVNESQDFEPKILQSLYALADNVSCGADKDQDINNVYDNDAEDQIRKLLNGFQEFDEHLLSSNFRNTREIFDFARTFVPHNPRPWQIDINLLPVGDKPEIYDELDSRSQLDKTVDIVELNQNNANIGIIVHFRSQIELLRDHFRSKNVAFSYYFKGMPYSDRNETEQQLQTPFITTFASCKGLEFDIAILPFFDSADWTLQRGHTTVNHYYVGATRARRELFVFYEKAPNLLNHFKEDLYKLNDEPCFEDTIISLSLGCKCIMDLKNRMHRSPKYELLLEPCKGESRYDWTHGIPARETDKWDGETLVRKTRISLKFRKVILNN
jgi:superfamily I DNA/RNA helicase